MLKPDRLDRTFGVRNKLGNCFSSPLLQSAKDIESRMRSETRLKLFTLDPDTQVRKYIKKNRF